MPEPYKAHILADYEISDKVSDPKALTPTGMFCIHYYEKPECVISSLGHFDRPKYVTSAEAKRAIQSLDALSSAFKIEYAKKVLGQKTGERDTMDESVKKNA